jgi:hypothetical protein
MRIYNDTLNPDIWLNENEIKPEIRTKLLQIANDFYKQSKLSIPIKDILLLGSNANYNWTPTSDLDTHILIDFNKIGMSPEDAKEYTNLIKYKWNTEHDIHIKTYNVEMYIQDASAKNASTGIYSLLNNTWITKPVKQNVVLDKELIQKKYSDIVTRIHEAIKEQNLESMKNVLKDVYDLRQSGLDRAGEFSTENVVFKLLRTKNHLDNLRQAIDKAYDKTVSVG